MSKVKARTDELEVVDRTVTTNVNFGSRHGYAVLSEKIIPHTEIKRGYNIRDSKNVERNAREIEESIRENGVIEAVDITPSGVALDGYTRLLACDNVAKADNLPYLQIKARVVNVPDKDIPLYQSRTGEAKKHTQSELSDAITQYAKMNPDVLQVELAKIFKTSPTTVNTAVGLLRNAPELFNEVQEGRIPQKSAKKLMQIAKKLKVKPDLFAAEVIEKAQDYVLDKLPDTEKTKVEKTNVTVSGREVNKALKMIKPDLDIKEIEQSEESSSIKTTLLKSRINIKPIIRRMLNAMSEELLQDGDINLSGNFVVTSEELKYLKATFFEPKEVKQGEFKIIECETKYDNAYACWLNQDVDGFKVIEETANFITFGDNAVDLAELLHSSHVTDNGLEKFILVKNYATLENLAKKSGVNIFVYVNAIDQKAEESNVEEIAAPSEILELIQESKNEVDSKDYFEDEDFEETLEDDEDISEETVKLESETVEEFSLSDFLSQHETQVFTVDETDIEERFKSVFETEDDDFLETYS